MSEKRSREASEADETNIGFPLVQTVRYYFVKAFVAIRLLVYVNFVNYPVRFVDEAPQHGEVTVEKQNKTKTKSFARKEERLVGVDRGKMKKTPA